MSLYFLVLDAARYHGEVAPALSASWRRRTFDPLRTLADSLKSTVEAFAERFFTRPDEPLFLRAGRDLPFDRDVWRLVAGEFLLYSARDIPEIETAPETLGRLLAPDHPPDEDLTRSRWAPIRQAHFGARDLVFGGRPYRPEQAGWNDTPEIDRLAGYLEGIDPQAWTAADLAGGDGIADEEECLEELEYVREWFPALRDLYCRARREKQVIVCEIIQSAPAF